MEILLIRHGQSANNAQPEHLRVCDPGLTELGQQQAAATARWLAAEPITHLYCSPFLRALETTRPIAAAKQMPAKVRPDIFEQGGCYSGHEAGRRRGEPGLGFNSLTEQYPDWQIDASIPETGWWGRGYETEEEALQRAERVAGWITEHLVPSGGLHALVIHADFKFLLIGALMQRSAQPEWELPDPLYNTGATRFRWQDDGWQLVELNSVRHLSDALVSH